MYYNELLNVDNLIDYRENVKGLTYEDTAERLGLPTQVYIDKENGAEPFTIDEFVTLMEVIGVPYENYDLFI